MDKHPGFDRRIARVINGALADLSARPTLVKAAYDAGLRPAYFSRRFRQVTGVTFAAWNARVRVEEAKRLLDALDLSMTAVAASVGYLDVTTFARVFRRHEGRCPREYRRSRANSETDGKLDKERRFQDKNRRDGLSHKS